MTITMIISKIMYYSAFSVMTLLLVCSCGGGGGSDADLSGDTTAPTISSTSPDARATAVTRTDVISAVFSEEMFSSTIDDVSFTVSDGSSNVLGSVEYDEVNNTVMFMPSAKLLPLTKYTATLSTAITDLSGNSLKGDYAWNFTTAAIDWSPITLNGTLTLTERLDAGVGNEAWDLTYTESDWATIVTGVIIKPIGAGAYPGVVVSHGKGGNAEGYGMENGRDWFAPNDYITIAVDLTHGGDISCRDEINNCGGAEENVRRSDRAFQILRSQDLIDQIGASVSPQEIMLYGNSLGSLTTLELAEYLGPEVLSVALSAGGIYVEGVFEYMTPNGTAGVQNVMVPVMHMHGRLDGVIRPEQQDDMSNAMDLYGVEHQQVWFPDGGHNIARGITTTEQVRDFIIAWFSIFLNDASPSIDSISVASASVGDSVEITGQNFGTNINDNSSVKIAGVAADIVTWADTSIIITVPAGAVSGDVEVTVPVGPLTDPIVEQPVNGGLRSNAVSIVVQ